MINNFYNFIIDIISHSPNKKIENIEMNKPLKILSKMNGMAIT
jgi:hypothetical protein